MGAQIYFDNYTPVGDLTVVAMCFVIIFLMFASYIRKTRLSGLYVTIVLYLGLAAISNIVFHTLYTKVTDGDYSWVYIIRVIYHLFLFTNLLLVVVYICVLLNLDRRHKIPTMIISSTVYICVIITDIISSITGFGFHFDEEGRAVSNVDVFAIGHIALLLIIVLLMIRFGRVLYKRVMIGFYGTLFVTLLITYLQTKHDQISFTCVTFLFPAVTMLYLVHANTFDITLGAANMAALEDTINYYLSKKIDFLFVSINFPDFDNGETIFTDELENTIRNIADSLYKGVLLYQISNSHLVYIARMNLNPDYKERSLKVIEKGREALDSYKFNYKVILGHSVPELKSINAYLSFIKNIQRDMEMNSVHVSDEKDVFKYIDYEFITSELADIYKKKDQDDPRVKVYCQPVYSIARDCFDTAETLMRLELPGMGIVPPGLFISLAEETGDIKVLTEILFRKTCRAVKELLDEGYMVRRLSVNLSMLDLRDDAFTGAVTEILNNADIPFEKIAFEVTESMNESDFMLIKSRISELKKNGIKFYLDDFGTGFSNMERILELPFDIIKFDRSLVIASANNPRSAKMVAYLAEMFDKLDYAVLYEGVETGKDEEMCRAMSAKYLQGYKYSKPVPIEELRKFFKKA